MTEIPTISPSSPKKPVGYFRALFAKHRRTSPAKSSGNSLRIPRGHFPEVHASTSGSNLRSADPGNLPTTEEECSSTPRSEDSATETGQTTRTGGGGRIEVDPPRTTSSMTKIFWPADLLPQTLPGARIFTWGYDVDIDRAFSSASTATVFQHASALLSDLADVGMNETEKKRPIIFIAHSLGGIVVKDVSYLVLS
jgi:hypothetical protein